MTHSPDHLSLHDDITELKCPSCGGELEEWNKSILRCLRCSKSWDKLLLLQIAITEDIESELEAVKRQLEAALDEIGRLHGVGSNAPESIASVPGLRHQPLHCCVSGIYFLCRGSEVVYVGQSIKMLSRIALHVSEKKKEFDYTKVFFLPVDREELDAVEASYIYKLEPEYNGGDWAWNERMKAVTILGRAGVELSEL